MSKFALPSAPLAMLVSDCNRLGERSLNEIVLAAIEGGMNMILLREPNLSARDLCGEAERLRHLAVGGVSLIIFDRADVALVAQADGVHLPANGLSVTSAKAATQGRLVGRTVGSVAEAVTAEQEGADYLILEPVFPGHYLSGRTPVGPSEARKIKAHVKLPLLASGGITAGNAHQVVAAGADGVAVTSEIMDAEDPRAATRALMTAMQDAWPTRPLARVVLAN